MSKREGKASRGKVEAWQTLTFNFSYTNYRSASYEPPAAFIDSISPNPANVGESVSFSGLGSDLDGYITAYNWRSSIDGF